MIELYKNIKILRKEKGLSQDALAKLTGYKDRSSIAKIEKGQVDLQQSKIELFAKALNTTPEELIGWNSDATACDSIKQHQNPQATDHMFSTLTNVHPIETRNFQMLDEIACRTPKYAFEKQENYVRAGTGFKADFCLTARGDSMINARILDGDIIFIRKQEMVNNGEIAAVVVNNDREAILKRFFYYQEKALLILRAENPRYEDQIYQGEELSQVHVLGKAVAFQSTTQ